LKTIILNGNGRITFRLLHLVLHKCKKTTLHLLISAKQTMKG
jgi:hypothetical protein